ncbi:MAG: ECF transporter S component [Clostridia bacterium]|nr:ECF transporter S component [Clostridia bacterium]
MKLTKTQFLTTNALLFAIVILFAIFPFAIGTVQLAFIPLIAIIISAQFIGLKNGLITGLFFGLLSLTIAFIHPASVLYFAFQNPLVSVLPRILIGVSAYFAAVGFRKLFPKLPEIISYAVGSAAGVITNTAGVLGLILAFYYGRPLGSSGSAISIEFISAIIVSNSLLEILICTVITPPIIIALKKAFKTK